MKIEEIINPARGTSEIINDLKQKNLPVTITDWSVLKQEYEPGLHKIMDTLLYPDKPIRNETGEIIRTEPITRVCIGLQKLAVKRMSEFMFTIPVNLTSDVENDKEKEAQLKAVKKVLKKNKWDSLNKKRCKIISSQCEQATVWYTVESENKSYGFNSNFKLKSTIFSPDNGDLLYPLFDETGDMIAFSREFRIKGTDNKEITFFETYTASKYIRWKQVVSGFELDTEKENPIGKIPIVYSYRTEPIWYDADNGKVHEIELLLSRNGEIVAYHASPVLIIKGRLIGAPKKGEANKVFFAEDGNAGAEYVSWNQSPESIRFLFESLLRAYFMELQLPDLSFENIKGIGAQSGESRKWLLVDAHLKVGDESEIYNELIERELNIIKSFIAKMNVKWANTIPDLEIEPEIRPFIIEDEKARVDVLVAANGGKPILSQKTSVGLSGLVENSNEEYVQLEAEWTKENNQDVFTPTN